MARAMWTGYLSFGLVSVPVGLFGATGDETVHFNQFHKGTSNRIRYKKVDEATGEEVDTADIVNGFDLGGGEYVVVTREELKQAAPGKSEMIEISDFVELEAIDPIHYRQTYYLGPRGKGSDRAYALLCQAMRESKRVAIATLVLRDKEHLVAIRPGDGVLILETMFFADEIRDPHEVVEDLPPSATFEGRELDVAKQLIAALSAPFEPQRYENSYKQRVEELIEHKRTGTTVVYEAERPRSNVIDLMSALEASVKRTGSGQSRPDGPSPDGPGVDGAHLDKLPATKRTVAKQKRAAGEQQSFEGMSKAELLDLAATLEVQGRSKMSKLELVRAIAKTKEPALEEAPKRTRRKVS